MLTFQIFFKRTHMFHKRKLVLDGPSRMAA